MCKVVVPHLNFKFIDNWGRVLLLKKKIRFYDVHTCTLMQTKHILVIIVGISQTVNWCEMELNIEEKRPFRFQDQKVFLDLSQKFVHRPKL